MYVVLVNLRHMAFTLEGFGMRVLVCVCVCVCTLYTRPLPSLIVLQFCTPLPPFACTHPTLDALQNTAYLVHHIRSLFFAQFLAGVRSDMIYAAQVVLVLSFAMCRDAWR